MKKNFFLQLILLMTLTCTIHTSCSKESMFKGSNDRDVQCSRTLLDKNELPENTQPTGHVLGYILPIDANAKVILQGDSEIFLELENDGSIIKQPVPVGLYNLYIQPKNTQYIAVVINDIEVKENEITDLGVIELWPGYYGGGVGCTIERK